MSIFTAALMLKVYRDSLAPRGTMRVKTAVVSLRQRGLLEHTGPKGKQIKLTEGGAKEGIAAVREDLSDVLGELQRRLTHPTPEKKLSDFQASRLLTLLRFSES